MHKAHTDHTGARIGMWLFLFTELLLFGGLFLLYSVYRSQHPADFHFCAAELDTALGAVNTAILLTSSLTMVLAAAFLVQKRRKQAALFLTATMLLGILFLVNKYFEWSAKFAHGLYPNSEALQFRPAGENIFYSLYYLMTGLHGLHIVIGIVIMAVMLYLVVKKPGQNVSADEAAEGTYIKLENSGLYWHMVDIIWIFLFPLFYLIT